MNDNEWDDSEYPLAYLITFRSYGTWLHGDERTSIDTHDRKNKYGTARQPGNENLNKLMQANMKHDPVTLSALQRETIHEAIREVCREKFYTLQSVNVRSNHVHSVVSARVKPEIVANQFKAYATRKLRENGLIDPEMTPWSRGRSRRYLWKPKHVDAANDYVLNGQGDASFDIVDDDE
jgi:REP element-mobilizing transposase RayT